MYNGWLLNWVILFKIEKWKVIGYDILLKKRYWENLMKIGLKSESGLDMIMRNS